MKNIGHRGAMGYEPENTLRSFRKALELGADGVELDVQLCKTGELVVIHDDTVERTTNGQGYVEQMSFEELRKLDAGKGEKIPTLHEVLDLVDKRVEVNIELRGSGTAELVAKTIHKYVNEHGWRFDSFLVSSFERNRLISFQKYCPEVNIGILVFGSFMRHIQFAEKIGAYSIHPSVFLINRRFVNNAHKRGLKVYVYTFKAEHKIPRMKKLGIDGIFTNFPDKVKIYNIN